MLRVVAGNLFFWLKCTIYIEYFAWGVIFGFFFAVTLRTAHMNAHSNKITGCDVSPDRKLFATVSLDLNLKVKPRKNHLKSVIDVVLFYSNIFIIYLAVLRCGLRRRAQRWPLS